MRVLYVLRYFPTLTENFVYREIEELIHRGHQVEVIGLGRRGDGALRTNPLPVVARYMPRGMSIVRAFSDMLSWCRQGPARKQLLAIHRKQGPKVAARVGWLASNILSGEFDRVHVHFAGEAAELAAQACSLTGIPYSVTVHAVDLFKARPGLGAVLAGADPVVTVAEFHAAWMHEIYGVESHVIRCGVEPSKYGVANTQDSGALRLISVGRNVPKKGHDQLVEVIKQLPVPVTLRLVSDYRVDVPDSNVCTGLVSSEEVPRLLEQAQLFVLACRVAEDGDRDGLPVAIVEAMASGLPIVATRVAGIPELVDDEVGWLIDPDDPQALHDALLEAASQPEERRRRGERGRERVKARGFTVTAQVDALLQVWKT